MSRTIKELSEGQIIYLNETVNNKTTYVPYIYLGLDEIGNAIILRKELVGNRRMNNINIAEYIGCDMDLYLNNMKGELWKTTDKQEKITVDYTTTGFLSRFDEATRNALTRTQIKHYILKDKTTVTLDRECFLLSYTDLGYATSPDEGKSYLNALKIANNTTNDSTARIARNSSGAINWYWMASEFSESQFRCCYNNGNSFSTNVSVGNGGLRPALSVLPSTIVSEQSEEIIYLLPDGSKPYRELDVVVNMGKKEAPPKKIRCIYNISNAIEQMAFVTVNINDKNPTWISINNSETIIVPSDINIENGCELGFKIYAKSNGRAVLTEPIMICE